MFGVAGAQGFEALFEMGLGGGVFGLVVEVVAFAGVGLEVVEFAFAGVHNVADEFVLLGADAAVGRDALRVGPLVVLVVPLLAEGGVVFLRERDHALALHV